MSPRIILLVPILGAGFTVEIPSADENHPASRELPLMKFRTDADGSPELLGWKPHQFEKIERKTVYSVVVEEKQPTLKAHSSKAASALLREIQVDPKRHSVLQWSWRVKKALDKADCTKKEGDDCAARILVLFRFDPDKASFVERSKYAAMRAIHGKYPPHSMLVYAWTEASRSPGSVSSPYSDRVRLIPLQRGSKNAGKWMKEKRNYAADYRRAFGKDAPQVEAIAVMVDTDNTQAEATAWFRGLKFVGAPIEGK